MSTYWVVVECECCGGECQAFVRRDGQLTTNSTGQLETVTNGRTYAYKLRCSRCRMKCPHDRCAVVVKS